MLVLSVAAPKVWILLAMYLVWASIMEVFSNAVPKSKSQYMLYPREKVESSSS